MVSGRVESACEKSISSNKVYRKKASRRAAPHRQKGNIPIEDRRKAAVEPGTELENCNERSLLPKR